MTRGLDGRTNHVERGLMGRPPRVLLDQFAVEAGPAGAGPVATGVD
jgi:hypothetical protein